MEAARIHETEIRDDVKDVSVESVTNRIAVLGAEISKTLSGLTEKLVQQTQTLANLKEAVILETKELERLHKIDIVATALDQLLSDYQAKKAEQEKETSDQLLTWEKEHAEADKRLLDQQIQSYKEKVAQQFESIQNLHAELVLAKKQVQDIAEKAIDGASGAKTLAHINQIAMEQAKRRDTQA